MGSRSRAEHSALFFGAELVLLALSVELLVGALEIVGLGLEVAVLAARLALLLELALAHPRLQIVPVRVRHRLLLVLVLLPDSAGLTLLLGDCLGLLIRGSLALWSSIGGCFVRISFVGRS